MSGTLQHWAAALALSLGIAGCGGSPGDNSVSQAAHAGLNTMRAAGVGHLQAGEARGIPLGELSGRLSEIDSWKDKPVVVFSRDGAGGRSACQILTAAGFQQVTNVEGGMVAWHQGAD
jgi:rhodanese-related sulfurtransferase